MEGRDKIYINEPADIAKVLEEAKVAEIGRLVLGYVDDERGLLNIVGRIITHPNNGFPACYVLLFNDPRLVSTACESGVKFDIMLSDYEMPYTDGIKVLRDIKLARPETITGLTSGTYKQGDTPDDIAIVDFFLPKPAEAEEIKNTLLRYARAS